MMEEEHKCPKCKGTLLYSSIYKTYKCLGCGKEYGVATDITMKEQKIEDKL